MISVLPKPNFSFDDSISSVSTISDEPAPIRILTRYVLQYIFSEISKSTLGYRFLPGIFSYFVFRDLRRKLRQNENFRGSNDFDSAVKRLTDLLRSDQLHVLYASPR